LLSKISSLGKLKVFTVIYNNNDKCYYIYKIMYICIHHEKHPVQDQAHRKCPINSTYEYWERLHKKKKKGSSVKEQCWTGCWWLVPVILATWEAEEHSSRPVQAKSFSDLISTNSWVWWSALVILSCSGG
jgi:hypothetical protein